MNQFAAKDSKAKIIDAFEQILAERRKVASRVATKEEEAEKEKNRTVLATVSQYTADNIVRGLADLQLEFGNIVTGLSTRLTTETTKLDDLKRAIATENQHLQELQQTRVVADALYLLTQEHQENLRFLEQRSTSDREILDKEIAESRKIWQREQEEFDLTTNESNELQQSDRTKQEEDYGYNTERSRKIARDEYEETKRQIERDIQETTQTKQKNWTEREQTLAANQTLLEEYQRKAAAFPNELGEAIKKAREEGIRDANQEAKIKADLVEKEWESTKQGYELQIQSLDTKIQKQTEQIAEITTQLQTALRQAQELAMRAFGNSPNRSTNP
ncbi:MAG TPA: hypothetical protein DCZ55_22240 [Cyanobacteria bacterium UBA11371]|nr:hypothetical protein [Cyanobacteria bacterium UBA11371]HBE32804.1 hypothetical protein [Cyanobacteria bacterium UBA11368]